MAILRLTGGGTQALRLKLQMAQAALGPAVTTAIVMSGEHVAQALSSAAPTGKGASGGQPPKGDAPGALSESFHNQPLSSSYTYAATQVITTQPTKLGYVRHGTGVYGPSGTRIRPRVKRALAWPGAAHPVRSVRGSPPNDFVTPVLEEGVAYAHERLAAAVS